jgi:hypothetical protein
MKRQGLAFMLLAGAILGGCAEIRYWRADDLSSQRVFYTADTETQPLGAFGSAIFISSEGTIVGLSNFELRRITEEAFFRHTGGATVTVTDLQGHYRINLPERPAPPSSSEQP